MCKKILKTQRAYSIAIYCMDEMLTYEYIINILKSSYVSIFTHIQFYNDIISYVMDNNLEDKKPLLKRISYFYKRAKQILNFKQTRYNYYDPKFYQEKYKLFNHFDI